jgi:hypothetical protein
MLISLKLTGAALVSVALAGCAARFPARSPIGPADPAAASAAHPPLRPGLVAGARTFLSPAAGADARRMKHSAPPNNSGTLPATEESYTCPMHPAVRADHPGNCPICGMTLMKSLGAKEDRS